LVRAARADITAAFFALAPLQPVRWDAEGLVCAPRAAADLAGPAMGACPLPLDELGTVPGWPDPPSDVVAGWYRRSPNHATAPSGVRELIQVAGPAFGAAGHETTALCLEALEGLPAGPAVDAGCGSGLLSLAWAALGRGPVLACDLDPDAVRQTTEAAESAGLARLITMQRGPIERLDVGRRVLLANVPPIAHRALLGSLVVAPTAALVAGMRTADTGEIIAGYAALGMQVVSATSKGSWQCRVLSA
jgi:ribosomal protein L11 methylase PrmA